MKNTISRDTLVKNNVNMKQTNKKLQILGAVALTAALATQAKADISYQISDYLMEYASVSINGGSSYQNELAGGLGITEISSSGSTGNAPSSYVALCTDFGGDYIYFGNTDNLTFLPLPDTPQSGMEINSRTLLRTRPPWLPLRSGMRLLR